jgi:hypothetical protein
MRSGFAATVVVLSMFGTLAAPVTARADEGCMPGNIARQVPRLTRPDDNVCVPTHIADEVH